MLYETLAQPQIIFAILGCSVAGSLLFDLANGLTYLCNNNKIVRQVFYFLAMASSLIGLFYTNLAVNFGRSRIYVLCIFFAILLLEQFTLGKLWTKLIKKWYNRTKERRAQNGKRKQRQA